MNYRSIVGKRERRGRRRNCVEAALRQGRGEEVVHNVHRKWCGHRKQGRGMAARGGPEREGGSSNRERLPPGARHCASTTSTPPPHLSASGQGGPFQGKEEGARTGEMRCARCSAQVGEGRGRKGIEKKEGDRASEKERRESTKAAERSLRRGRLLATLTTPRQSGASSWGPKRWRKRLIRRGAKAHGSILDVITEQRRRKGRLQHGSTANCTSTTRHRLAARKSQKPSVLLLRPLPHLPAP